MPVSKLNGIDLAWEYRGGRERPAILLIQGLGMPAAAWPPAFIDRLLDAGFGVISFDNRDMGASEVLDYHGRPNVVAAAIRRLLRLPVRAPYSLLDMALDAEALLDELGVRSAHVVGVSMGGMIAQNLALHAPARVASLTSIMSTTNDRDLPDARFRVQRFIVTAAAARTDAERRAYHRKLWPLIGSPGYPHTRDELEDFIDRILAAGISPAGRDRQTLAIIAESGRSRRLAGLDVPTLVIHGEDDPLVPVECGKRTAASIPGARLRLVAGMGHDLPRGLLRVIATEIEAHVRGAERLREQAA